MLAALGLTLAACGTLPAVQQATRGAAIGTGGSNRSMIFLAPTEVGPIVIDLGWTGAAAALEEALDAHGWSRSDIAGVLLTHAHRDHLAAWPVVIDAPFYLSIDEVPLLTGREAPPGGLARLAHHLWPASRPAPGRLELRPFARDTVLTFGRDTVRAFVVPGHTRGSAAYLLRGVLFVGDAAAPGVFGELGPPSAIHSLDRRAGARRLARLIERAATLDVRFVCTAHGRCVTYERAREALSPREEV